MSDDAKFLSNYCQLMPSIWAIIVSWCQVFEQLLSADDTNTLTALTLSSLQTNTDTFANSVDPDETAHNEQSHQDLNCAILLLWLKPWFATMDVSKCIDGKVHVRNPGVKGLIWYLQWPSRSLLFFTSLQLTECWACEITNNVSRLSIKKQIHLTAMSQPLMVFKKRS